MKHTLKRQMMIAFTGSLMFIVILLAVVNSVFLGKYYSHSKQKTLIDAYERTNKAVSENTASSDDFTVELDQICDSGNISMLCMNGNGEMFYQNAPDEGMLKNRLLNYLITGMLEDDKGGADVFDESPGPGKPEDGPAKNGQTILKETDCYQLVRITDARTMSDFLELWGIFDSGGVLIMRVPMESIHESVSISNHFLLYVLIIAILLGIILALFFASRITKPVRELTELSGRMADLDFDARYTGGVKNEIGVLGDNFNRMSEALEKAIDDLRDDIEKMEKVNIKQNEFIGNVSHELKTPIALIRGYAEGLSDQVNTDPESQQFYLDVIIDEADKMNRLVRELLDLNQLELQSKQVEKQEFNISEVIRGVVSASELTVNRYGVKLNCDIPETVMVNGDPFQIEQVVTNYLNNALVHAKDEKEVDISLVEEDSIIRVKVSNTGDRLSDEDRERIWEKFYKTDKSHSREYGGSGIGLSIVKAIVENHGGKCGVDNTDNGVSFYFTIEKA